MAGGRDDTPKTLADVERLKAYWAEGPGAAKIVWDTPGDFDRCRALIQTAVTDGGNSPLSPETLAGLCSNLHKRATGFRPGHAPGDKIAG